jgi:hypothetical protein
MPNIAITTASVPADYCGNSLRETWAFLVSLLQATLVGEVNLFNYGATTPAPDDQDKPWIKLDANGNIERIYSYSNGAWVARHPVAAGTVIMYEGSEASIPTFDGGEAGTVTATTGPMWEKVSQLDARFPMGPGTLPSGLVVNVGDTGGEEKHELTEEEIPQHTHVIKFTEHQDLQVSDDKKRQLFDENGSNTFTPPTFGGDEDGNTVAHNTLPPYRGIFFLRKTARTHYRN